MSKKMHYDNTEVVVISSKPSSERKKYTEDYMGRVEQSTKKILKTLEQIQEKYPNKQSE